MSLNSFDKIAWLYDPLARLVFGDRLMRAQIAFLHQIKVGSRVLILGGGTGAIVSELLARQPDCHIAFVDASQAMLKRARKRLSQASSVEYIHGTEASIPVGQPFDIVITPFYLDMFTEEQLPAVIQQIMKHLSPSSLWLIADFCSKDTTWKRMKLSAMYAFFRFTTGIAARMLPDWNLAFKTQGWKRSESFPVDGFIEGAIYTLMDPRKPLAA